MIANRQLLILPLIALLWNGIVYSGGRALASGRVHYDMTLPIDRITPFFPWTMAIYWGCFLFWIVVYLWMAAQERKAVGHFFFMHFIGELICFAFFVFLPSTNIRPAVPGTDIWSWMVRIQYHFDEANNLFPSIHCMVSWLCWIGLRKQTETCPKWFRRSSFAVALAVCISTLTLKQHVIADVIGAIIVAESANLLAGIPILLNRYIHLMETVLQQPIKQLSLYKHSHKGGAHEVST